MSTRARGFTLIELMFTITVLAVLLGLAIPSFRQTIENNRTIAQTNEFVATLNYARSEALKRANPVSVCSSVDGITCAGSTDWSTGWVAFGDTNANGTLDGTETPLQSWGALTGGFTLTGGDTFVRYASTGVSSAAANFSLLKTGCTGDHARQIGVTVTGRISSAVVACP